MSHHFGESFEYLRTIQNLALFLQWAKFFGIQECECLAIFTRVLWKAGEFAKCLAG